MKLDVDDKSITKRKCFSIRLWGMMLYLPARVGLVSFHVIFGLNIFMTRLTTW
jgi:hypothetical protein